MFIISRFGFRVSDCGARLDICARVATGDKDFYDVEIEKTEIITPAQLL